MTVIKSGAMRWAEHVARVWADYKRIPNVVRKSEKKREIRRSGRKLEDNILYVPLISREYMD